MAIPETLKNIKYEYIRSNNYSPVMANGVIGGPTSKGDLMLSFFLEFSPLPDVQVHEVVNGGVGHEIMEKRRPKLIENSAITIVRQLQNGIIMNFAEAKVLHKWLGDQLEALEKNFKL